MTSLPLKPLKPSSSTTATSSPPASEYDECLSPTGEQDPFLAPSERQHNNHNPNEGDEIDIERQQQQQQQQPPAYEPPTSTTTTPTPTQEEGAGGAKLTLLGKTVAAVIFCLGAAVALTAFLAFLKLVVWVWRKMGLI
ncbi:uncharacterized protein GGS25DRAFT_453056 [Hypoxylon fragiforme]|uniref:uncharacterized protein n=1 Tax=Hypoxylon fragiforme TaxID=63214 RepID=UPI0020C6A3D2|nr:uncharacterized protein GGS25DRAFT_453056 [Hypoxylon fragiforme]KAI2604250.1 hypothetical protein GGS25DRAFT_453056 [Hypoxylon fragiforme]